MDQFLKLFDVQRQFSFALRRGAYRTINSRFERRGVSVMFPRRNSARRDSSSPCMAPTHMKKEQRTS